MLKVLLPDSHALNHSGANGLLHLSILKRYMLVV